MRSMVLAGVFGFSIAVTPNLAGAQTPLARAAAKQVIAKLP